LEVGDPQGNGPTFADFPVFDSNIQGGYIDYSDNEWHCIDGFRRQEEACVPE
jgi:hypothetical protein